MATFIAFSGEGDPPLAFRDLARDVDRLSVVAAGVRDEKGGLRRAALLDALAPALEELGFDAPAVELTAESQLGPRRLMVDAFHCSTSTALEVHAGRAWMNHEATTAVLKMAAATVARHGIVVVPDRYKGAQSAANIIDYLRALSTYSGVRLDIDHVAVVTY